MISACNRPWIYREPDARSVLALSQRLGISNLVARVLVNRGIDLAEGEHFLKPSLRHFLPNPSELLDMDKAVERVLHALHHRQKITVYGDYDVDGATSTALLRRYFRDIGIEIDVYIPDRLSEGYGANTTALLRLRSKGVDLVLMTDCGTTASQPLTEAKNAGLDIIVLDHHLADLVLPPALVINPNRFDQPPTSQDTTHLCAAGVAYLFIIALQRALRSEGFFKTLPEPDLFVYLDVVALGTVCDVMRLTGLNRAFVRQGLKILRRGDNLGLRVLCEQIGLDQKPSVYHLGFMVGPRINAGGRVGECDLGTRLLSTTDRHEAVIIAKQLQEYNAQRQVIEREVLDAAHGEVIHKGLDQRFMLLTSGQGWHPGVIGIVASRLKEHYNKPACVVGFQDGEGKGSGRSVPGVHLGDLMHRGVREGLLLKGGGHAMAAGFSVSEKSYDALYTFLEERLKELPQRGRNELLLDGQILIRSLNISWLETLEDLEPFGPGNPPPRFEIKRVRIRYLEAMGQDHLRAQAIDDVSQNLSIVAFRSQGTPIQTFLEKGKDQLVDIAGTMKNNTWKGYTRLQMTLDDIRYHDLSNLHSAL